MYHPKRRTKTTQLNQVLGLCLTNYSAEYISCFQYIKIIKTIKIKLIKGKKCGHRGNPVVFKNKHFKINMIRLRIPTRRRQTRVTDDLNSGLPCEQIQLLFRVGLELGVSGLRFQRSNHSGTLPLCIILRRNYPPTHPSVISALTLTSHLGLNVGLGERTKCWVRGGVGA